MMHSTLCFCIRLYIIVFAVLFSTGCASETRSSFGPHKEDGAAYHLGNHSFPITTTSPEAQSAFDRGLTLAYAFSHKAAETEFRRAAALDPEAAMPWWGVALVNGPHINYPLVPEFNARMAWVALSKAKVLGARAGVLEQSLIAALAQRYVENPTADRSSLDRAYARAMKAVSLEHPASADVLTLYAEAQMDLHPWDLWERNGDAKPWTEAVLSTLEAALAADPKHPGANHLYIHAVEASPHPESAVPSADTLMTLVPGAGHLVHMPAHIYLRVGRLEDAATSNINAIKADAYFRQANPNPGFYRVYMMHNHHFLAFVRMMQGQREKALNAARGMLAGIPEEFIHDFGAIADGYFAIVHEVLMRFGKWQELLAEPAPRGNLPISTALWRFARTSALTALDRFPEARAERRLFLKSVKEVPADAAFGNNNARTLLAIARHVIDGEMAARQRQYPQALYELRAAQRIEDTLMYDEPPDWILPVRHALGAALLAAGKPEEAETAYREDLEKFPKNGWSLYGLSKALRMQGKELEAQRIEETFDREWAEADTIIESSCLCQRGAALPAVS